MLESNMCELVGIQNFGDDLIIKCCFDDENIIVYYDL